MLSQWQLLHRACRCIGAATATSAMVGPSPASQGLRLRRAVEDACQFMEAFFFAGQHGRIGGAA